MDVGVDQPGLGVRREDLALLAEFLGVPLIIRVKEREQVAAGFLDSPVSRRRRPPIRLIDIAQLVSIAREKLGRVVRRAIVYNNDLKRPVRLREYTADRLSEETGNLL